MNKLILNRVAIWSQLPVKGLSTRTSPAGRVYYEDNVEKRSNQIMHRYAKNYNIGKGKKTATISLMVTVFSDSEKHLEAFLDSVAEKIDYALAEEFSVDKGVVDMEYLDYYYKESE